MAHENSRNFSPQDVVSIPVPLFKSIEGEYFVGQTETLTINNTSSAWAGLVNPQFSDVNLFANVFTVSNFSDEPVVAEIWLNTNVPSNSLISDKVSPTNTSLIPLPQNRVQIEYAVVNNFIPKRGVNVYPRIVPPKTTLVGEEDGKFIEQPGGDYVLIIRPLGSSSIDIVVGFGWWERPRC